MRLTETDKAILGIIRHEQGRAGKCPCRGSNEMCGCQNKEHMGGEDE